MLVKSTAVAGGTYPRTILEGTILARDSVSGKMIVYVIGGTTNGDGVPKEVLTYDIEVTAAGDTPIRGMVTGVIRGNRLVVDADGDNSNINNILTIKKGSEDFEKPFQRGRIAAQTEMCERVGRSRIYICPLQTATCPKPIRRL